VDDSSSRLHEVGALPFLSLFIANLFNFYGDLWLYGKILKGECTLQIVAGSLYRELRRSGIDAGVKGMKCDDVALY
jgi:hypothetical protein